MEKAYQVFCCSALEDDEVLQSLKKHLQPLQSAGFITIQTDNAILAGTNKEQAIRYRMEAANIILPLISVDFLASDYCFNDDMLQAIARHKQGTAYVIPLIIRPTDWQTTPFGQLQALPRDGTAVSLWLDRDDAFLTIIREIRTIIPDFPPNPKPVIPSLQKGSKALWNGDYPSAKKLLRVAVEEIDGEDQPREASKANYLLALALLDGQLPLIQGRAVMQSIDRLMNNAIRLYPSCASYYRIFARIKKDFFEHSGFDHRLNEVYILERKGASLPRNADDEENEEYFRRCQPRLQL